MGFRNTEEIIAGIFATAVVGQRIVIDGTQDDGNRIQFYSGVTGETAPGYLQVATLGAPPTDAVLTLASPALGANPVPTLTLDTAPNPSNSGALLDSPGSVTLTGAIAVSLEGGIVQLSATTSGQILLDHGAGGEVVVSGGGVAPTLATDAGDLNLSPNTGTVQLPNGVRIKRGGAAAPTLLNGWTNLGTLAGRNYQTARYFELPDHTGHLAGVITGSGAAGQIMQLPSQMWPDLDQVCDVTCNAGKHGQVAVRSDGGVFFQNMDTGVTWASLNMAWWPLSSFG